MVNYLLDTNHASPLVTLHHPLRRRIHTEIQSGHSFAVCAPITQLKTENWLPSQESRE